MLFEIWIDFRSFIIKSNSQFRIVSRFHNDFYCQHSSTWDILRIIFEFFEYILQASTAGLMIKLLMRDFVQLLDMGIYKRNFS